MGVHIELGKERQLLRWVLESGSTCVRSRFWLLDELFPSDMRTAHSLRRIGTKMETKKETPTQGGLRLYAECIVFSNEHFVRLEPYVWHNEFRRDFVCQSKVTKRAPRNPAVGLH